MMSADLSSVGLILDILGAIMIWKYGLPVGLTKSAGPITAIAYPESEEEAREFARYEKMARTGVALLITGFALQLAGTVLGRSTSSALKAPAALHQERQPSQTSGTSEATAPTRKP